MTRRAQQSEPLLRPTWDHHTAHRQSSIEEKPAQPTMMALNSSQSTAGKNVNKRAVRSRTLRSICTALDEQRITAARGFSATSQSGNVWGESWESHLLWFGRAALVDKVVSTVAGGPPIPTPWSSRGFEGIVIRGFESSGLGSRMALSHSEREHLERLTDTPWYSPDAQDSFCLWSLLCDKSGKPMFHEKRVELLNSHSCWCVAERLLKVDTAAMIALRGVCMYACMRSSAKRGCKEFCRTLRVI